MRTFGVAIIAVVLIAAVALGEESERVSAQFSPIPLYPREGIIPPELSQYFVFLDTETWDIIVSYPESLEKNATSGTTTRREFKIPLSNHVSPQISARTLRGASGKYTYQYLLANKGSARQPIRTWYLSVPQPQAPDPADPASRRPEQQTGSWRQIDYSYSPGHWAKRWDVQTEDKLIQPGSFAATVEIESDHKPGFAMAYFQGSSKQIELPETIPQQVLDQLVIRQNLEFNSVSVLTIGPKYTSDTPARIIAGDYHVGINMLINRGSLQATSPFIKETLSVLEQLIESQSESPFPLVGLKEKPVTPVENEILDAITLALFETKR